MIAIVISEGIVIAVVTGSFGLMIAVLSTVRSNKSEVVEARVEQVRKEGEDKAQHLELDTKVDRIIEAATLHAEVAAGIETKLDTHIVALDRALERNEEAHTKLSGQVDHIEGWIEGQRGT